MAHVATNSRKVGAGSNVDTNNGALAQKPDGLATRAKRDDPTVARHSVRRCHSAFLELKAASTAHRTSKVGQLEATHLTTATGGTKSSADALQRLRGGGRKGELDGIDPGGKLRCALSGVDFGDGEAWTQASVAGYPWHDRHALDKLLGDFSDQMLGRILRDRLSHCPCGCGHPLDMPCYQYWDCTGGGCSGSEGSGSGDSSSSDDSSGGSSSSDESNRLEAKYGGDRKRRRAA